MHKDTILKILTKVKGTVKQEYNADIKGIFGSYLTGKEKRGSDIDVLVDFSKGADLLDLVGLALFLEKRLKRKVDIVPRDSLRKEIKASVLRQAVYL